MIMSLVTYTVLFINRKYAHRYNIYRYIDVHIVG